LEDFFSFVLHDNDIILDFFAGSGTTGHAVMKLNAEDGANRKYIMVQIAEPIDSKKNKTAYDFVADELKAEPTIFEITKERLRIAARKIKEKNSKHDLDLGFKIFETMPIWEDYEFHAERFENTQTLFDVGKLTIEDTGALITTWKTYDGMPLTKELEAIDLDTYTAHYGNNKLYLMRKGFSTEHLKGLLERIDTDKSFNPSSIIAFGHHFESKNLRELTENIKSYANKKNIDIEFTVRY
jgi:adenine-specific DNA-methyltransferase